MKQEGYFLKRCSSERRGPPQKRPRLTLRRRSDAPRTRQEHVIRFDELPGAKIIGKAVEVRHIFEWAKKGTDNEEE